MAQQTFTKRTLTLYNDDGTIRDQWVADIPDFFRAGAAREGKKGERCCICDDVVGATEGIKKGGKFYCFRRGCYKDVVK